MRRISGRVLLQVLVLVLLVLLDDGMRLGLLVGHRGRGLVVVLVMAVLAGVAVGAARVVVLARGVDHRVEPVLIGVVAHHAYAAAGLFHAVFARHTAA